MIIEEKKVFFNTIQVILEDEKIPEIIAGKKYSRIILLSNSDLALPHFTVKKKTTALINLKPNNLDDIFKTFSETTRNEIRKTAKIPELHFAIESDKEEGFHFYQKFEYAQGRVPYARSEFDPCTLFLARYNNEPISGIFVYGTKPYLRIRSIFSKRLKVVDKELYKIIGYSTRRLMWEICQWGKAEGYESLDLASVNFNNPETANITKFKMSFGGEVVNEYTYTYRSAWFKIFELFSLARVRIKKYWQTVFKK
jgi:hypothetical protein